MPSVLRKTGNAAHRRIGAARPWRDTPFIEAHTQGFYDKLRNALASMLHTSLKTSNDLQYAMLTGIQRVAKENTPKAGRSLFSDLNNLSVCTVNDSPYTQYFGFTEVEVKTALQTYAIPFTQELKQMYDGYNMGGIDIYNPWSVINYLDRKQLIPYWVNTSSNKMIKAAMRACDKTFKEGYEELIERGTVTALVNYEASFYEIKNTSSLWGLFVNAGYLTTKTTLDALEGRYVLRIPNKEIKREFQSLTAYYFHTDESSVAMLLEDLLQGNLEKFALRYQTILEDTASYYDLVNENSYHTLLLGMLMPLENSYKIISNREKGQGRFDICLESRKQDKPSFLFELKYTKDDSVNLKKLAMQGYEQILAKQYDHGLQHVIRIGLAHRGKQVELYAE